MTISDSDARMISLLDNLEEIAIEKASPASAHISPRRPVVLKPVYQMQIGDEIVTQKSKDGMRAVKTEKVSSILRSRRQEWVKVNGSYIYYLCGQFETAI